MADQKKQFSKVNQLRPLDTGLNLTVKVINAKTVAQRGRNQGRFSECLVGDETGIIIFSARNDQGEHLFTILSCRFAGDSFLLALVLLYHIGFYGDGSVACFSR